MKLEKMAEAFLGVGIATASIVDVIPGDELIAVPAGIYLILDAFDIKL